MPRAQIPCVACGRPFEAWRPADRYCSAGCRSRGEWAAIQAERGAPHCILGYEDLERWRGPIVYVWSRGADVLYVGMSARGLERPLSAYHEKLRAFEPGDTLTVWRADDPVSLETTLIQRIWPALNNGGDSPKCQDCGRPAIGRLRLRDGRCEACEFLARPHEAQARALDKIELPR
jgi:hypothetical protein